MNNSEIRIKAKGENTFDMYAIALAIRNSTYKDELKCSLRENKVMEKCEGCGLKFICDGINNLSNDFIKKTTKTVQSFSI